MSKQILIAGMESGEFDDEIGSTFHQASDVGPRRSRRKDEFLVHRSSSTTNPWWMCSTMMNSRKHQTWQQLYGYPS
jgi:hypothetical protein